MEALRNKYESAKRLIEKAKGLTDFLYMRFDIFDEVYVQLRNSNSTRTQDEIYLDISFVDNLSRYFSEIGNKTALDRCSKIRAQLRSELEQPLGKNDGVPVSRAPDRTERAEEADPARVLESAAGKLLDEEFGSRQ
jgi:hypothetical protein